MVAKVLNTETRELKILYNVYAVDVTLYSTTITRRNATGKGAITIVLPHSKYCIAWREDYD